MTAKQVTAALQHELATIVERFGSDATTSSTAVDTRSTDSTDSTDPSGPPTRPSRNVASMSNLPPPTPGGAAFQPDQPTTAFTPLPPINEPAPKKRSKRLFVIIGAAVVVVAALVVVGLLVFGGDDDGDKVDTKTASGAVEDVTDAASLDSSTHAALLEECPFDGVDDLADDAPKGFDAAGAATTVRTRHSSRQTDAEGGPAAAAVLDRQRRPTLGFGVVAAAQPPTGLQDYINRSLTDATGKFEDTTSFRGGTLLPFCTEPKEGSDQAPAVRHGLVRQAAAGGDLHPRRRQFDRRHHGVGQGGSRRSDQRPRGRRRRPRRGHRRRPVSTSTARRPRRTSPR